MRAKTINEIKRGDSSGALSSLGVGRVTTLNSINFMKEHWPEVTRKLKGVYDDPDLGDPNLIRVLARVETKFGIDLHDFLWMNYYKHVSGMSHIESWFNEIKFTKKLSLYDSKGSEFEWFKRTIMFKYSPDAHVGLIHVQNVEEEYGPDRFGYIIQYK